MHMARAVSHKASLPACNAHDTSGVAHTLAWASEPGAAARRWLAFATVAGLTTVYSLLVELSKRERGGAGESHSTTTFAYSPLAVTFCAEALKLGISAVLTYSPLAAAPPPRLALSDLTRAMAPAALYCLHNNLCFSAMRHLTPPLYQLLSQLKICVTAALARVVLHQRLSPSQAAGVALLTLGSAVPGLAAAVISDDAASVSAHDWLAGAATMVLVALTSGACHSLVSSYAYLTRCLPPGWAAVYTEHMLKRDAVNGGSLHFRNMQLYTCGCAIYTFPVYRSWVTASPTRSVSLLAHLTANWTPLTFSLVIVLAVQGLAISYLVKAASNFSKLFAGGAATFVSIGLSVPILGVRPRTGDGVGAAVVALALWVFHRQPAPHAHACPRGCDGPGAVTEAVHDHAWEEEAWGHGCKEARLGSG